MKSQTAPADIGPKPPPQILALVADTLAWPLLLLRGDGTLIHANLAARRMLEQQRPLLLGPKQRVQPSDTALRPGFQAALATALLAHAPAQLLQWPTPAGRLGVTVSALRDEAADEHPLLLVALSPEPGSLADLHAYAALRGLSEAETRVLMHLARGDSSAKAAAALGVSAATVRSQTVSLRRKTGHPSVAELMRDLAALPPLAPLPDDGEK